jgi:hypothetical protein
MIEVTASSLVSILVSQKISYSTEIAFILSGIFQIICSQAVGYDVLQERLPEFVLNIQYDMGLAQSYLITVVKIKQNMPKIKAISNSLTIYCR